MDRHSKRGRRRQVAGKLGDIHITVRIPYDDWRRFQIQLLVDHETMQHWTARKIEVLSKQSLTRIQPWREVQRVDRSGRLKQVIARVDPKVLRDFRIRLAAMGAPMSSWLLAEIRQYTKNLDLTVLKE